MSTRRRQAIASVGSVLNTILEAEFQAGRADGISAVERILAWTTRKPPMSMATLRGWIETELKGLKERK